MLSNRSETTLNSQVNYEGGALVELTVDAMDYRIDAGKQGTAFSISSRPTGTWNWTFLAEARWDGSDLRCRGAERVVLAKLSGALSSALSELE